MFCSECGKQVADDAKFCGECGAVQADVAAVQFTNHHQRPTSLSESNVDDKSYTSSSLAKSDVVIIITVVAIFAVFLYSSGFKFSDEEQIALNEFKESSGQKLGQCVGANGTIDWSIFKSTDSKANVRVIEAKMKKGEKNFTVQYLYNLDTKVFEVSYMSNNDEPKGKLAGAMELGIFCI